MDESRPIPPFKCEAIEKHRLSREWEVWKGSLECYFEAYGVEDQRMKKAKLLHLGGIDLQRIFKSLPDHNKVPMVTLEPKVYNLAIELLDGYFQSGRQDIIERRNLRKLKQEQGEKFSHFMMRLRQQAINCGFEKHSVEVSEILKEIYLIDVVVENCYSDALKKSILKRDRSLREIEELAATIEATEQQLKDLKDTTDSVRDKAVYDVRYTRRSQAANPVPVYNPYRFDQRRPALSKTGKDFRPNTCFSCGKDGHIARSMDCPARGRTCRRCQQLGHFEAVCLKQGSKRRGTMPVASNLKRAYNVEPLKVEQINSVPERNVSVEDKVYYAFYGGNDINVLPTMIGGIRVSMLVDSGADANLITVKTWEVLKHEKVNIISSTKGSAKILKGYGSDKALKIVGTFQAEIAIGKRQVIAEFFVVDGGQKDLLGDFTAKQLGVLKIGIEVNKVVDKSLAAFNKISGVQARIHMNPEYKPVFQPLRRVPIPMEDAVNRKLEQLLLRDIIEVKQGPTTWVSPLVVVGKASGEPRLCLDLRRVNEAVVRERFPMPVVEEYIARLGKGKIWSKLDIREAFHQVELAPESRDITTFITSRGLFRFKRLPFGLVTAPEIFQRIMEELLSGCEGTFYYLDDIIVEGETKDIHDENLKKVK
ncbi:uncharacterized protein K02A2.6-like [Topomyia yanbarensis]|uniref:uncharacterized protein K02A2.6-like n=1 Tax=Topomyia yanbarensis TaxID=2498891 RepID=UPI00273A8F1D|nr:uncharacterized protein K02A2.6-like [Topomyia yanbarensis]